MTIISNLEAGDIFLRRRLTTKDSVLRELSSGVAARIEWPAQTILTALQRREDLGSTGIGHGIAIPHARFLDLPREVGLLLTLERPIDFAAVDGQPVDLIFLLLTTGSNATHLHHLAAVARFLKDPVQADNLRAASNVTLLLQLLKRADS